MALSNRRIDGLAPIILGVWVVVASYLSPLRSQLALTGVTPLSDACLCNGFSTGFRLFAGIIVALLSGAAAVFARRVQWPLFLMAALAWLMFSMWGVVTVASYYAGERLSTRATAIYLSVGSVFLVTPATVSAVAKHTSIEYLIIYCLIIIILLIFTPYAYGRWVRARRSIHNARQESRTEHARQSERDRIAREMHDVVAHRVSLIVLHAGALELAAKDERTRTTADLIRTTGRDALAELRQVLGVLRGPAHTAPLPTLADVESLVEQTRNSGVPVQLRIEGDPTPLPSTVDRTAYRVVQEGLTNVVKHAGGPDTEVLVRRGQHELTVVVQNGPPRRHTEHLPGSGLGLIGLRERVELLHGSFEAASRPDGGFAIRVQLPLVPSEA